VKLFSRKEQKSNNELKNKIIVMEAQLRWIYQDIQSARPALSALNDCVAGNVPGELACKSLTMALDAMETSIAMRAV